MVEEAALALVLLGEAGQLRLAELVARAAELSCPVPVLASVALWDSAAALAIARRLAVAGLPPEWQFQLCLGLGDSDGAIAAVRADAATWFRRADWDRLTRLIGELPAALGCADAPHHHAYQPALAILLSADDPGVPDALRRFVEIDASRPVHLRRAAARRLLERHGDPRGLPILIEELNDAGDDRTGLLAVLAPEDAAIVAEAMVSAALIGGHAACNESRMWQLVEQLERGGKIDAAARAAIAARVLDQASTAGARRAAAQLAVGAATADDRLTRVAEIFAWGIRRGVELTGRLFRVHMTGGHQVALPDDAAAG